MRSKVEFDTTTDLFIWNYESRADVKVNQGGTSSGKTIAILQTIFIRLIEKKRIASVVGQDIPNLKRGALRDMVERIMGENKWMWAFIRAYNKSDRIFYFKNGSILEFVSFSDEQDAKNGKRDISFFNEANGLGLGIYNQVVMRTSEEVFIDYNPTAEFWCHDVVMRKGNAVVFYSNFKNNPYVDENVKAYLFDLKRRDLEAWRVYGLGKTGAISDLCFPKIEIVKEMPKHLKKRGYGMDFGYRVSPTTLVECGLANEMDVYLDENFFVVGMTPNDMALTMRLMGVRRGMKVWADPADYRAVQYLRKEFTLPEFTKRPDSVRYGISLLNQYNLFATERSVNMLEERKRYRFKQVKRGEKMGSLEEEPVDAYNHTWDGIRYWAINNLENPRMRRVTPEMRGGMA